MITSMKLQDGVPGRSSMWPPRRRRLECGWGSQVTIVVFWAIVVAIAWPRPAPADAYPRPGETMRTSVALLAGAGTAAAAADADLPPGTGYQRPGVTERVSVSSAGAGAGDHQFVLGIDMSADGRFVAFATRDQLALEDKDRMFDVYVRDRQAGTTERVSLASDGTPFIEADPFFPFNTDGGASNPSISDDGRYVAFQTYNAVSTDVVRPGILTANSSPRSHIWVRDRASSTTEQVDVPVAGSPAVDPLHHLTLESDKWMSRNAAISGDGRFVAFSSRKPDLVSDDTNGFHDVFVRDRLAAKTERVNVAPDGSQATDIQNSPGYHSAISADGRFVSFTSTAGNLVPGDTNEWWDVFVRDRQAQTTERVSMASDGSQLSFIKDSKGNKFSQDTHSSANAISADGRFVAFATRGYAVPTDTGVPKCDVYVRDRQAGSTERVIGVAPDGREFLDAPGDPAASHICAGDGASLAISGDGRFVAGFYVTTGDFYPSGWQGGYPYVDWLLLHDRATGATGRVDVASDGSPPNATSSLQQLPVWLALSGDGRHVAFPSTASNLSPGDADPTSHRSVDVFVRDRGPITGIGDLSVAQGALGYDVAGWATFSGATVAAAADSGSDGDDPAGAEITAASLIHRPELEDLLLRVDLASLPATEATDCTPNPPTCWYGSLGGDPDVLYRWRFTVAQTQTQYEVRVRRVATADGDAGVPAYAGLFECAPACSEIERLGGAIGTTGLHVRAAVPLDALGIDGAADLSQLQVSVARGDGAAGDLDALALPDAHVVPPRVDLGVAAPAVPEDRVPFATTAGLVEGRFSATVDLSGASGPQRLWARACLGEVCGVRWVDVDRSG